MIVAAVRVKPTALVCQLVKRPFYDFILFSVSAGSFTSSQLCWQLLKKKKETKIRFIAKDRRGLPPVS